MAKRKKRNATSRGLAADPRGWLTGQLAGTKVVKRGGKMVLVRKNPRRRNESISEGFWNATGFHPIRAADDYDPGAVDERYQYAPKKKKKGKRRKGNPSSRAIGGKVVGIIERNGKIVAIKVKK